MTSPRIYTARRRTLQNHDALPDTNTNSITVPSDYGSDIEIDAELLAVSAEATRTKEGDAHSDYGSDFDIEGEAILEDLLGELEGRPGADKEEGGGDGRGVAFVPLAVPPGRKRRSQESLGETIYFSCESEVGAGDVVCGNTGEAQEEGEGEGGGRTHIARKFVILVVEVSDESGLTS